jgi:transposase-like protein
MRQREWTKLKAMVAKLTFAQSCALKEELVAENDAVVCVEVIGTGRRLASCTHCRSESLVRNGSANGLQRHKCRRCGPTFSAVTGTPLARLRQKPKWLAQGEALRDGTTIRRVATLLKVARSTAFRWRHRFLALPKTVQAQALMGIAEADETFFLRSRKGQRHFIKTTSARRQSSQAGLVQGTGSGSGGPRSLGCDRQYRLGR